KQQASYTPTLPHNHLPLPSPIFVHPSSLFLLPSSLHGMTNRTGTIAQASIGRPSRAAGVKRHAEAARTAARSRIEFPEELAIASWPTVPSACTSTFS